MRGTIGRFRRGEISESIAWQPTHLEVALRSFDRLTGLLGFGLRTALAETPVSDPLMPITHAPKNGAQPGAGCGPPIG